MLADLIAMDDGTANDSDDAAQVSMVGPQVSDLLVKNGIKKKKVVEVVTEVLQVANRTARRKLYGQSLFTDGEITKLLDYIGYEYKGIYGIVKKAQGPTAVNEERANMPVRSMIELDGKALPCNVWIRSDDRLIPAARSKVAIKQDDGLYKIVDTNDINSGVTPLYISKIEIVDPFLYEGSGPYLAIFDEDAGSAQAVANALRTTGFSTKAISNKDELLTCFASERFEAFVLTWAHWCSWMPKDIGGIVFDAFPNAPVFFITPIEDGDNNELNSTAEVLDAIIITQPTTTNQIAKRILRELRSSSRT